MENNTMRKVMRERRREMGQTQADIAKLIGIEPQSYSNIERGARRPSADILLRLAAVMGMDAGILMEYTQTNNSTDKT
jgi:transcriptional regulator with XRE-family HTH domain